MIQKKEKPISLHTLFSSIVIATLFFAFTTESDFSGEWEYNEAESDLGETQFRFVWETLEITQTEEDITIVRRGQGQSGPVEITDTITLDGEISENTGFGGSVKKSTANWSDDGGELVIESTIVFEAQGQSNELTSRETFSLDDTGNTLSLRNEVSSNFGEVTQQLVYEKN